MLSVLVTGAAGFIGAALCQRLLQRGDRVVGLDNLNDYYDPTLKHSRLRQIEAVASPGAWRFEALALEDAEGLHALFASERPQVVVNLAAQAGVVTPWRIRRLTSKAIWWALVIFWKGAATTALRTWCTPRAARSTAAIAICPSTNVSR